MYKLHLVRKQQTCRSLFENAATLFNITSFFIAFTNSPRNNSGCNMQTITNQIIYNETLDYVDAQSRATFFAVVLK